eukprot:4566122-Prymnesium_polylepis.1
MVISLRGGACACACARAARRAPQAARAACVWRALQNCRVASAPRIRAAWPPPTHWPMADCDARGRCRALRGPAVPLAR